MPIVDIQVVLPPGGELRRGLARELADALGTLLQSEPGRVWVRLEILPADRYAENGVSLDLEARPVFVRVMHARSPLNEARAEQARAIARSVGAVMARPAARVHVEYAPDAAGRMAFGGVLVR